MAGKIEWGTYLYAVDGTDDMQLGILQIHLIPLESTFYIFDHDYLPSNENIFMIRRIQIANHYAILLPTVLGLLILFGCNKTQGYKTQSGLIFYVYDQNSEDSTAQVGNVLKLNVKKYVNDSLVENTYDGLPKYEQVMPGMFYPYEPGEIYPYFHKGDSIVLIQDADSMMNRRMFYQVPSYVSTGDKIVTHFKVLDVFLNDSTANADMNDEYPKAILRNRLSGASRLKDYLDKQSITAELTPDTVYIEEIEVGAGPLIEPGDMITIRFVAKTLSGIVFGDNTDEESVPMDYEVMSGTMPIGIEESLLRSHVGDHSRFYLPAMKAFGASPPPGGDKGFQDMIFEVEILRKNDE